MPWWAWFILCVLALLVVDQAVANICNTVRRRGK